MEAGVGETMVVWGTQKARYTANRKEDLQWKDEYRRIINGILIQEFFWGNGADLQHGV